MKPLVVIGILVLFFSGRPEKEGNIYTDDFHILVQSLQELDPMIYKMIPADSFNLKVNRVDDRLLKAADKLQALYIMQEFMYDLGDSHASLTSSYGDLGATRILPFKVYIIDHRIYIRNYPADTSLNGAEILAIDNVPASTLIDSLKIFYPNDGKREIIGFGLPSLFNSLYAAFCHEADNYSLQTDRGMRAVKAVKRGDPGFAELYAYSWWDYAFMGATDFKSEITNDYGYFRFTGFDKKEDGFVIEDEFSSLIRNLNNQKINNLVIDLRYNGGGDPYMAGRMASYFTSQAFPVFQRLLLTNTREPKYASYMVANFTYRFRLAGTSPFGNGREKVRYEKGLKNVNPRTDGFKGQVYVLTGSMTGSSSTMFCHYLEDLPNVTFVGSETEGATNYFCAHKHCELTLPFTHIYSTFGTLLIELKKGSSDMGRPTGLIPDQQIHYTISDLLARTDKEMEWVKADIAAHH